MLQVPRLTANNIALDAYYRMRQLCLIAADRVNQLVNSFVLTPLFPNRCVEA